MSQLYSRIQKYQLNKMNQYLYYSKAMLLFVYNVSRNILPRDCSLRILAILYKNSLNKMVLYENSL